MNIRPIMLLIIIFLTACQTTPQPSENTIVNTATAPSQISDSGIEGTVTIGPTCPVEQVDNPCPDKPFQGTFIVLTTDGTKVTEFQTDEQGHFQVKLTPGDYVLRLESPKVNRISPDTPFNVAENTFTMLDIQFDSGIR